MKKITLLRHAEVLIDLNKKIYANKFNIFLDEYKTAEISNILINKKEIISLIKQSDIIISSEEKRAKDSYSLYSKSSIFSNNIYNEAQLPTISLKLIKLKTKYWLYIFRVLWLFSFSKNCESFKDTKIRAKKAANELINLNAKNKSVLLFSHGIINKLIKKDLIKQNYKVEKHSSSSNWDYDILFKD
ncbi:MAG: hypothetical protein HRT40_07475 [Campylobacteraceae bacterium]|nr:hypothetical protein [Campylobacteraceae bacterium]